MTNKVSNHEKTISEFPIEEPKKSFEELETLVEPKPFIPVESKKTTDDQRKKAIIKFSLWYLVFYILMALMSFILVFVPLYFVLDWSFINAFTNTPPVAFISHICFFLF